MKQEQLQQIIREKNDLRERHVVRNAEEIIEAIVVQQTAISNSNARIVKLRDELKALEVESLDPQTILGEV